MRGSPIRYVLWGVDSLITRGMLSGSAFSSVTSWRRGSMPGEPAGSEQAVAEMISPNTKTGAPLILQTNLADEQSRLMTSYLSVT